MAARGVTLVGLLASAAVPWARGDDGPWATARLARIEPSAAAYEKINGRAPQTIAPPMLGGDMHPARPMRDTAPDGPNGAPDADAEVSR
ncbi:MAG: hypothetical protein JNL50_11995 [Phycisphaerae bacterium]|nr:hypothetical protein [Phycisphaerae bacterium]